MKSLSFLRTAPGAVLATGILAITSTGAYALTNWFNANVTVTQKDSIISVDLSGCQGNLPPGVDPGVTDRHAVQFKVTGNPHISAHDLQQDLLGECEASSVTEFYAPLFPDAGLSSTGHPATFTAQHNKYALLPGVIVAIDDHAVTIRSTGAKSASFETRAFSVAPEASIYSAGRPTKPTSLQAGDSIMFLAYAPDAPDSPLEGTSVLDDPSLRIVSIFKTQYNDGMSSSLDYQSNNIMPLDVYNQLHHKK